MRTVLPPLPIGGGPDRFLPGQGLPERGRPAAELRQAHQSGPGPHRKKAPAPFPAQEPDLIGGQLRLQPPLSLLPEP